MRICQLTLLAALPLLLSSNAWSTDFATGWEAYNSGDYETTLTEWRPLAEAGDADGQFGMGLLYGNGYGVELDDEQALKWYGLAASQGHAKAQCNIAVMYANGWGVPQSDEEALKWYSLAAEQGVTPAQINVGRMYAGGFGAAEDKVQGHKWFSIAAELGDDDATFNRDILAATMSAEEIAESNRLRIEWMESHQNLKTSWQTLKEKTEHLLLNRQ
jgi:TPR repeat protein